MNQIEIISTPVRDIDYLTILTATMNGIEAGDVSFYYSQEDAAWNFSIYVFNSFLRNNVGTQLIRQFISTIGNKQLVTCQITHSDSLDFIRNTLPLIDTGEPMPIEQTHMRQIPFIRFLEKADITVENVLFQYRPPGYQMYLFTEDELSKMPDATRRDIETNDMILLYCFGHT